MSCFGKLPDVVLSKIAKKTPSSTVFLAVLSNFWPKPHLVARQNSENWKSAILVLPDVAFHKNRQILTILVLFLAFLSNFWQNHIW